MVLMIVLGSVSAHWNYETGQDFIIHLAGEWVAREVENGLIETSDEPLFRIVKSGAGGFRSCRSGTLVRNDCDPRT